MVKETEVFWRPAKLNDLLWLALERILRELTGENPNSDYSKQSGRFGLFLHTCPAIVLHF
jgi:hypothetical protein